jgi:DNA-binding LacI/PurR family transcriptional regulator
LVAGCHIDVEGARAAGRQLLGRANPPTAILAFDDVVAWGVWKAAEELGLVVGRDLALAGYGDTAAGAGFSQELTSVRVDMNRLGEVAAAELGNLMNGKSLPGKLVLVPAELVVRASSRNARPKDV